MNVDCLAISTAWNLQDGSDIKEKLSEIKSIGLNAIEIGYNFSTQRLQELTSLVSNMDIRVVSVHNFCPLPSESRINRFATDYYRLSSPDKQERRKAVDYTKRSIDTACLVSARVVVIHAGVVEIKRDYVRALLNLYNEGKLNSRQYLKAKDKLLKIRQLESRRYLDFVVESLQEILPYACSAGVNIGLETRYYPHEIPDIKEAEYLLSVFKNRGLFYWHDVGHAEVNEKLGITSHRDYLMKFADCMLGIHLHDLKGIDDHMAPFSGDFDFSKIATYLHGGLIKVIEAHPPATRQQIREAVNRIILLMRDT